MGKVELIKKFGNSDRMAEMYVMLDDDDVRQGWVKSLLIESESASGGAAT